MKKPLYFFCFFFLSFSLAAQITPFEKSNGTQSATYFEAIDFYKKLDKASNKVLMKEMGPTDAGYPLHLVLVSADGIFDPLKWHKQNKVVILIMNGIHAGEPDGIDASMMFARDIVTGKLKLPKNVCIGIIPVYNIGGCLNRRTSSRANQNGPEEYGFRGNSQNLDLNRDFTKCDSREARSFTQIFHWLDPDIQIDTHVSDGADYQYTMTLITTQPDKLAGELGQWLKNKFDPLLYKSMYDKGWGMCPYVDFEVTDFDKGMNGSYDPPRYSSGYAALWQTISYTTETHMLKPFKDRVLSTYAFLKTVMEESSRQASSLITFRAKLKAETAVATRFPLSWKMDTTQYNLITFNGYEKAFKPSDVTGMQRMYYDHTQPFSRTILYYNTFQPAQWVNAPAYYIIPQGWWNVVDLLKLNKIDMWQLKKDSVIAVEVYKIQDYKSAPEPYEKHHRNTGVKLDTLQQTIKFLKGDYIIPLNQSANRFVVEMLEPSGDDSYFSWNFFDAVLQQKEYYSNYRWEDVAADLLKADTVLQNSFNQKRKAEAAFAKDASAQLNWVYKHSNYYEPEHLRYPIYRISKK